jgi:hypothetical protein
MALVAEIPLSYFCEMGLLPHEGELFLVQRLVDGQEVDELNFVHAVSPVSSRDQVRELHSTPATGATPQCRPERKMEERNIPFRNLLFQGLGSSISDFRSRISNLRIQISNLVLPANS